jgi:spermidine/putrescine transport system substrate-binding protein
VQPPDLVRSEQPLANHATARVLVLHTLNTSDTLAPSQAPRGREAVEGKGSAVVDEDTRGQDRRAAEGMSRRQVLRSGLFGGAALIGLPAILDACSSSDSNSNSTSSPAPASSGGAPSSFSSDTLNLFTWSSYDDPPWIKEYEQSRGVTVNVQYIGSVPEGFAKTKANPAAYDIVLATSSFVQQYAQADLIIPVDESKVPNIQNIVPGLDWRPATKWNDTNYGIVYNWGDEPMCWLTDKTTIADDASWSTMWDPKYEGVVSLVDDPTTFMPTIPIYLGFPNPFALDSSQMSQMQEKLFALRGNVTHVTASIDDQTNDFANGQVMMGVLYNISTQVVLKDQGIDMKQIIPSEGAAAWSDNFVITKGSGAQKLDLVYDFIDYTLSVPWQARFAATSGNTGILSYEEATSPEAVDAGMTKQALDATLIPYTKDPNLFTKLHLGEEIPNLDEWLNMWNEFKLGLG